MNTILVGISVISVSAFIFGVILGFSTFYFKVLNDPMIEKIDYILPQSQCAQCGYPGCRSYAEAIINDYESINKCIPGGKEIAFKIYELVNPKRQELNEVKLTSEEKISFIGILKQKVAFVDEENCIGCTKCIQICPVDAIVGTMHVLHTVVEDICTGCNLCVTSCPTDCITMLPIKDD